MEMKVYLGPYPSSDKKERAIRVRIDKCDGWSLDHTLALIIAPSLEKFKENVRGYPQGISQSKWHEYLDKMIWSFKEIVSNQSNQPKLPSRIDQWKDRDEESMTNFLEHLTQASYAEGDLEKYRMDMKEYSCRLQGGLDLFAKWYRHLWS